MMMPAQTGLPPLRGKQINFDKFALKRRVKELAGYPKTKEISAMDPFWL
jgi:hypothetical protein